MRILRSINRRNNSQSKQNNMRMINLYKKRKRRQTKRYLCECYDHLIGENEKANKTICQRILQ